MALVYQAPTSPGEWVISCAPSAMMSRLWNTWRRGDLVRKLSRDLRKKTEELPMSRMTRIVADLVSRLRGWPRTLGILALGLAILSSFGCQMESKKGFGPGLSGSERFSKFGAPPPSALTSLRTSS